MANTREGVGENPRWFGRSDGGVNVHGVSGYLLKMAGGCSDGDDFHEKHQKRIEQDFLKSRISGNFRVRQRDTIHSGLIQVLLQEEQHFKPSISTIPSIKQWTGRALCEHFQKILKPSKLCCFSSSQQSAFEQCGISAIQMIRLD